MERINITLEPTDGTNKNLINLISTLNATRTLIPYKYIIGEIDLVEDFNNEYVTGTSVTVTFSNRKPANLLLVGTFFNITEAIESYTGVEVTSIVGQSNMYVAEGDIKVDITLSGANAQDWTAGKIEVYALIV